MTKINHKRPTLQLINDRNRMIAAERALTKELESKRKNRSHEGWHINLLDYGIDKEFFKRKASLQKYDFSRMRVEQRALFDDIRKHYSVLQHICYYYNGTSLRNTGELTLESKYQKSCEQLEISVEQYLLSELVDFKLKKEDDAYNKKGSRDLGNMINSELSILRAANKGMERAEKIVFGLIDKLKDQPTKS